MPIGNLAQLGSLVRGLGNRHSFGEYAKKNQPLQDKCCRHSSTHRTSRDTENTRCEVKYITEEGMFYTILKSNFNLQRSFQWIEPFSGVVR
jgi:hypothetical protein